MTLYENPPNEGGFINSLPVCIFFSCLYGASVHALANPKDFPGL